MLPLPQRFSPIPPQGEQDPLSEESLARPPGLECYSADGDHLPRPPGFRRELDRSFFGELWEPELDTDPALAPTLPQQLRMQAHIHRHRWGTPGRDRELMHATSSLTEIHLKHMTCLSWNVSEYKKNVCRESTQTFGHPAIPVSCYFSLDDITSPVKFRNWKL